MDLKNNLDTHLGAIIIADLNDHVSTVACRNVLQSIKVTKSKLIPVVLQATTPETLDEDLKAFGLTKNDWTYPKRAHEKKIDIKTGLHVTGYAAQDLDKVISCTVSHMRAWYYSIMANAPICVFEHDAYLTRKLDYHPNFKKIGIVGLNDPRGATRKSGVYFDKVIHSPFREEGGGGLTYTPVPWVDDSQDQPQGLAGNSAYIISPQAAKKFLDKINDIGLWPNDALMCKQFFPYMKQAYPFYTKLQGVQSTTQG